MTAAFKVYCGVAVVYYHDGAVHYCDVTDYCTVDAVISIEEDYENISITKFVSEHFSGYSCQTLELKQFILLFQHYFCIVHSSGKQLYLHIRARVILYRYI